MRKLSKFHQHAEQVWKLRRFLRPIPYEQRKQVYLPDFTITLIRTPYLPPRFASFWVPLSFNKLDIKDYLKRLYGVDVLKVRSYVEQQKVTREMPRGREGVGSLRRPMARKKMTVELKEPFVWPEEPTDFENWDKKTFFGAKEEQEEFTDSLGPDASKKEPKEIREKLAEQAKNIQKGNETWKPTWQVLGLNYDRPGLRRRNDSSSKQ